MLEWLIKEVLVALIVGIVPASIFLGLLSRLRPKIEISPRLGRKPNQQLSSDGPCFDYLIKISNRTWPRQPIVDVRCELVLLSRERSRERPQGKATFVKRHPLPWHLRDKGEVRELLFLPTKTVAYRFRYSFTQPLEEILAQTPDAFLRFRLFGRHALSGFGAMVEQQFTRDDITDKEFEDASLPEIDEPVDPEQLKLQPNGNKASASDGPE